MVRTSHGRWMPVDVEPTLKGNMLVHDGHAVVLTGAPLEEAHAREDPLLRISHFATCPYADEHRR
ncbi:MAG TPA: hypothetical protein VH541_05495 [Gaiellaceae bacterium]